MIRSPAGRAHCRTKQEFDRELSRVEAELSAEETGNRIASLFARIGYYTDADGNFIEVESGATIYS